MYPGTPSGSPVRLVWSREGGIWLKVKECHQFAFEPLMNSEILHSRCLTRIQVVAKHPCVLPLISAESMAYLVTFAALPDGALHSFVPLELPWRS
jgi:hypothetical protein